MAALTSSSGANGFIAVLIITRSRPGPKLVFHYPPMPQFKPANTNQTARKDENELSESDSESDSDSDSDNNSISQQQARRRGESTSTVCHLDFEVEKLPDPQEQVLGVDVETLEKLLSPGRWCERKKFEVCLDGIVFVGLPVFAREDGGGWSKREHPNGPQHKNRDEVFKDAHSQELTQRLEDEEAFIGSAGGTGTITITRSDNPAPPPIFPDHPHLPDSLDSSNIASLGTSMNSTSTTSAVVAEQMTMFHVVFALAPQDLERQLRTTDVYKHIAAKLGGALKHCQKQHNYVGLESRKLQTLKTKARLDRATSSTLWTQMLEHSELAWALKETYRSLSLNETATTRLDGKEMSLQIPPKPSASTPVDITPSSALLLVEDREVLLQALATHSASPLPYFIRETLPTKTLSKQAAKLGIPEKTLLYLAEHLITWRKARPISALHPRNTYIVSPDAPLKRVRELSEVYARRFPALPGLEKMLAMLGDRPVRFGALIQSPAHRARYVEILAWLVRYGFVVQLKTFGWLKQKPEGAAPEGDEDGDDQGDEEEDARSERSGQTAVHDGIKNEAGNAGHKPTHLDDGLGLITDPLNTPPEGEAALQLLRACAQDSDLGDRFESLLKHFDGEHAFEDIAASEGVKRAKVEDMLSVLEKEGWICSFRAS